jgi:FAD/FMN-containing dehydrogenase
MIDSATLNSFEAIVGARNTLKAGTDLDRYLHEPRNNYTGQTPMVLKPVDTDEVSRILCLASETATAIVPQGGHTGLAGGAVPNESSNQIVVSLERMNAIREIDPDGNTIIAEAGVVLQSIQDEAARHDLLFPLSLASQGSCQIGGNISTNAGGTGVLAYGNTRDLVLGLEVVLPNGEIWNGLRKLKKDNTGYSLKDLFIGAEGTLGIVTVAVLKLFPLPKSRTAVWAGLPSPDDALALFNFALARAGNSLTGFELIHRTPLEFVLRNVSGRRDPLAQRHEWYVLAEISSGRSEEDANMLAEAIFAEALNRKLIGDAVLSQNEAHRNQLWQLREEMSLAQRPEGASIKHDISVPVHRIPGFIEKANPIIHAICAEARPCIFGHMGDGNLHFNVSQPAGGDREEFLALGEIISKNIYALVVAMSGSISAEHGIGQLKRTLLATTKSKTEIAMMRAIKQAFDPQNIMNPGKLL